VPGKELIFRCPCGYLSKTVTVGATEKGHYLVVLCLDCQRLFSVWRSNKAQQERPVCKKCGKGLTPITAPGAWGPTSLQNKFPDLEPWIIENGDQFDEEQTDEELAELGNIKVLCPKCRSYSLEYEIESLWD
jgi:hypothetical protein